jgi:hypothetical protein
LQKYKAMNFRYIIFVSFIISVSLFSKAQSPDFTGIKVCIDPGHSGHEGDDRGMSNGFWESESNLTKGLFLKDLLEQRGAEVFITRTTNTGDDAVDDWPLSQRAQLANDNNADLFISIHSNAGAGANYPLTIFNGKSETPAIPEAKVYAKILWEHLITNEATHWTNTQTHYIGDLTLNPDFTYGYGVLYPLVVPGIISEGSMHDYGPEMYRLLSLDYRKQESWNIYYSMVEYFELSGTEEFGQITGLIHDSLQLNQLYNLQESIDKYYILNDATVKLLETGEIYEVGDLSKAQWYFTNYPDKVADFMAGYYYFDSLTPGNYHLVFSADKYVTDTIEVAVEAHKFTYFNAWLKFDVSAPPQVVNFYPEMDDTVHCNEPVTITFNINMDSASVVDAFSIEPEVEGVFSWDDEHMVVTFQPLEPYATQASITVRIDTTAKHNWGVSLEQNFSAHFYTDNRNRYNVESIFPTQNQTEINPYLQFRVVFDAPLNTASLIDAVTIESADGTAIGTKAANIYTIDNKGYYYFKPADILTYNTAYKLKLSGSIQDIDNIPLVETVEVPFTTQVPIDEFILLDELESTDNWALDYENSIGIDPSSFIYRWTKEFRSGEASLLVRYLFTEAEGTVSIAPYEPIIINSDYRFIGLWIWGELSDNQISLLANNQQVITLSVVNFAGWNYCYAELSEGLTQIQAIQITRTENGAEGGDVYLDALSLLRYNSMSDINLQNAQVWPNPIQGNTVQMHGLPMNEKVVFQVTDIEGRIIAKGNRAADANGSLSIELSEGMLQSNLLVTVISGKFRFTSLIVQF